MEKNAEDIKVEFDQRTHSAIVSLSGKTAPMPFPVYSQREADIMGRELARNLGWLKLTKR